jgi:hypothetical protein
VFVRSDASEIVPLLVLVASIRLPLLLTGSTFHFTFFLWHAFLATA